MEDKKKITELEEKISQQNNKIIELEKIPDGEMAMRTAVDTLIEIATR